MEFIHMFPGTIITIHEEFANGPLYGKWVFEDYKELDQPDDFFNSKYVRILLIAVRVKDFDFKPYLTLLIQELFTFP